jgi:hypothetical protein|tara:strand:+ start:384 stop:545 length:162 start_codon:yes stop_codon:yes gene_type:complete
MGQNPEGDPPQRDPKTHRDAIASDDADKWIAAERKKLRTMRSTKPSTKSTAPL